MPNAVRGVPGAVRASTLALLVLCALARPVHADQGLLPAVDPRLGPDFGRVVDGAAARLSDPGCAAVLGDFDDSRTGRPLAETLAASGRSPAELLSSLSFLDADHMVQCRYRPAWAWIPVGGNVVFVCRRRFLSLAVDDATLARNVLLHEALHSLGLGENPPRSEDITAAVARRCGR